MTALLRRGLDALSARADGLSDAVSRRLRTSETAGPLALALVVGIVAGMAAVALRLGVDVGTGLFQHQVGGWTGDLLARISPALGGLWPVFVVALGGMCAGLISRIFAPEAQGHGVPEVLAAILREGGRIKGRVALVKLAASAFTIGSGGSAGKEGPIVQIGAAAGSRLAQWLRLSDRLIILGTACGAAGGISATFNAPMAGVLFVLEVVLRRFTTRYFGLVVISSLTATVTMRALSGPGDYPHFVTTTLYGPSGLADLVLFMVLGLVCALGAQFMIQAMDRADHLFSRYIASPVWRPAVGGLFAGLIACMAPLVMGSGYDAIRDAINLDFAVSDRASSLAAGLSVLFVAKVCATALTVGSGGSGGVFVPALFAGASLGGAFGTAAGWLAPGQVSPPGAYAMVGMSAFFAASAHAPMTGIILLVELTDNYNLILPLMGATVLATFASQRISPFSIYTSRLRAQGIELHESAEVNLMDAVTVGEAMDEVFDRVSDQMSMADLIEKFRHSHQRGYPVVDAAGELVGIVALRDVEEAILRGKDPQQTKAGEICTRRVVVCRPDQTLTEALSLFGGHGFGRIPVIDPENPRRVIGVLRRGDILKAYLDVWRRSEKAAVRDELVRLTREKQAMTLVTAVVGIGSPLSFKTLKDMRFPEGTLVGAVRRGHETLMPRGDTSILPGDELVFLTTWDREESLRNWLRDIQ